MGLQLYQKNLLEKLKESLGAVLPIIGIMLVLCFSIAPIPNSVLMTFVVYTWCGDGDDSYGRTNRNETD